MPLPDPTGYSPSWVTNPINTGAQPPQYILDAMGGSYDQSKYYWDQERMALVDRTTGGSYGFGDIPDPSLGTDVVLSPWQLQQNPEIVGGSELQPYPFAGAGGVTHFAGDAPFIGSPDGGRMFISNDPAAISEYNHDRRTRGWQGIGQTVALVGGGAALGATGSGPFFGGTTGVGTGTVAGANTAAGTAASGGGASLGAIEGWAPGAAAGGGAGAGGASLGAIEGWAGGAGGAAAGGNFLQNWLPYITGGVNTLLGYNAADDAADAEAAAFQAAIDEQRRQYDTTRSDLMPWLTAGQGALGNLQNPGTAFTTSPGYEWRRSEGERDTGNFFSAKGGVNSGNAMRALEEFRQGLASSEFGNWWNQQAGLAGVGQTAGTNLGSFGATSAGNVGNALANQGISRASGVLGKYGAIGQGLQDATNNWLYRRPRR